MDLIQVFTNNTKNITVNIRGTLEEPLFQANQIGELLDLKNIRKSIIDFDEDENKHKHKIQKMVLDGKTFYVNTIESDDGVLYRASDIGKLLGVVNIRKSLANKSKNNQVLCKGGTKGVGRMRVYLKNEGVKAVIANSRSANKVIYN